MSERLGSVPSGQVCSCSWVTMNCGSVAGLPCFMLSSCMFLATCFARRVSASSSALFSGPVISHAAAMPATARPAAIFPSFLDSTLFTVRVS